MVTYLAGPIAGCSDQEMFEWRSQATKLLLGNVLDPARRDYRGVTDDHVEEIVEKDKAEIDKCKYVLANCPRPSYGTIMEILYSWERDKKVIVVVPPGVVISPWLRYHSHIILKSVKDACMYIVGDKAINPTNRKGKKKDMSSNKFNYYTVTTTTVVRANNKTDALALASNRRGISGQTLSTESDVERIPAAEARSVTTTV